MSERPADRKLEMELVAKLARTFPGMTVEVGNSARWNRMCVTFRWVGFAKLLPEERFHRVVSVLPERFRKDRLDGFVWMELTPSETVEEFLKLPRSEDVTVKEARIYAGLVRAGYFDTLRESLGSTPEENCPGDFSTTVAILDTGRFTPRKITEAKLLFIRHGAFCDCQVLQSVQAALEQRHAGAA
jgi:hypothetical protein